MQMHSCSLVTQQSPTHSSYRQNLDNLILFIYFIHLSIYLLNSLMLTRCIADDHASRSGVILHTRKVSVAKFLCHWLSDNPKHKAVQLVHQVGQ